MKTWRRWVAALCVPLMAVMVYAGWAGTFTAKQVNVLMAAPFADSTKTLVQQFNREHRGRIHLHVTRGPLETEAISDLAISSLLLGKAPFDVLLMDITWVPKYAAAGWLIPLDPWFNQEKIDSLAGGVKLGNSYNNTLYRWPFEASMGLLFWRTDLMDEPPRTPEDLIAVSQKLQREGRVDYGYVWQGRQYEGLSCDFLEVIDGFGGDWFDPETDQVGLDSPAALKAAGWLRELITSGVSPKAVTNFAEPESLQAFRSGDSAMMRNWPFAWAELQKPDSAVRGHVGVTTMVAAPGHSPAATLGSWGLAILKGASDPDAAAEVVQFLTSESAQKQMFLNHGYAPTQTALFQDPELLEVAPILLELGKALEITRSRPETPLYAQISDVLQRQLSGILTGQDTVEQGMNGAQSITEQVLASSGDVR